MSGAPVRLATPADVAFMTSLEAEFETFVARWSPARHRRSLAEPDFLYLVLEGPDGRPAGFAVLAGLARADGVVELVRIVVARPGAGLGGGFIDEIKRIVFDEKGARRLWLDVVEENARARAAYCRAGFVETERRADAITLAGRKRTLVLMAIDRDDYYLGR